MICTDAVADFVGSAWLTAVTLTMLGEGTCLGATYAPVVEIVPYFPLPPVIPFTLQVTPLLDVFCTEAANCFMVRTLTVAVAGEMATVVAGGACVGSGDVDGGGGGVEASGCFA